MKIVQMAMNVRVVGWARRGIAITVITPIMPTNGGSWRGFRKRLPSMSGSTTSVMGNRPGKNTRTTATAPASATRSASARSGEALPQVKNLQVVVGVC